MLNRLISRTIVALAALCLSTFASAAISQGVEVNPLAAAPVSLEQAFKAKLGNSIIVAGGIDENGNPSKAVYSFSIDGQTWEKIGELESARSYGASASDGNNLYLIGGRIAGNASDLVTKLTLSPNGFETIELTRLPLPLISPAAIVESNKLYVAGGTTDGTDSGAVNRFLSLDLTNSSASWLELDSWTGAARHSASLIKSVETISLIGGIGTNGNAHLSSPSYNFKYGWADSSKPQNQGRVSSSVKLGDSHAAALIVNDSGGSSAYLYHMIGETWVEIGNQLSTLPADAQLIGDGNQFFVISTKTSVAVKFGEPDTNYGWWDHLSVGLYFIAMIWIGFHFSKQSVSSEDYFRGGHKIPWWATGMSLFATGASAMSLMAMPGKSYSSNWTFFAISIYSVISLPLSLYFLAPLIRKLNFGTAFEYLERRFGLSVRILGSSIFAISQILARMGSVLLIPSFALEAIAGIPMQVSVPIMGLVTIAYTYLGGLSAVIWTDTIQGFVMIAAVAGCLILVFFNIDMPSEEIWTTLTDQNKLHIFDWGMSLTQENVFTVFLGIVAITLLGIGDQNYVQRVQCSKSLKDTKKAIATQMGVAVPINLLLFALGTALFLFYKQEPADINPVMRNDGIFPFFAAQQLPPGVSGLVIAALLAATMSTVSSSICSVSNLAVDDFYKRFSKNPTDKKSVSVGRAVTLVIGLFGIASAFYLYSFETPSIWDLFLRVSSIITATMIGTFALGLFSKRANEKGILIGIAAGMAATYFISTRGLFIFWLYPITGSIVTYVVGYAASLATGGNKKDIDGLTIATIGNRTGGLDD